MAHGHSLRLNARAPDGPPRPPGGYGLVHRVGSAAREDERDTNQLERVYTLAEEDDLKAEDIRDLEVVHHGRLGG